MHKLSIHAMVTVSYVHYAYVVYIHLLWCGVRKQSVEIGFKL